MSDFDPAGSTATVEAAPNQAPKSRGVVDIVFLVDITGSMQPCIDALKANIARFIDFLTTKDANNAMPVKDWRAKVVGYRDWEFDRVPYVDNPFVREPERLKTQLAALVAEGGHDEPECLLDALYKVATMGQTEKGAQSDSPERWRYRSAAARVVVVFTDATYKERLFVPEAKGGGFDDVVNVVTANRLLLSIFAPDMECYDRLASIDKSEYEAISCEGIGPQRALAEFTSDTKNFQNALKQLAASVSKSAATEAL